MLRQAIVFFCLCRLFQNTQFHELEASWAVDYIAKIDPKTFCLGTGVSGRTSGPAANNPLQIGERTYFQSSAVMASLDISQLV